jgi:hypothetical protein
MKNINIKTSELGKEGSFISGGKYHFIEWAEWDGKRFSVGDKVSFLDRDTWTTHRGVIDWMIVTEDGGVELSIVDAPIGRVDLENIKHVK